MDRPCQAILSGSQKPRDHGVVITSYELAVTHAAALKAVAWSVLILDECHMLAHRTSRRTKAVYGANSRSPGIVASAARVIRLSGTPMPSDASQIFTHLKSAGLATESYYDFLYHFTSGWDSNYGYVVSGHRNVEELKQRLSGFMLRKSKEEVLKDLPPLFFQTITVPRSDAILDPSFIPLLPQLAHADQELQAALSSADPDSQITMLEKTASSVTSLRRYILMCKLPAIVEQLEEDLTIGGVDKLIVFGIHRVGLDYMAERLNKFGVVTIHGGTEAKKRQENIDAFQNKPETKVFLANITAGGVGINLQNCSEIVFLELPWTPSDVAQACGRAHRLGQKNTVRVRIFALYNSVDERVSDVLLRKTKELAKIL
jgi:SWI/SNF-related matrix-associated actin-dependent regulator 1 of chromatin subfamily A